MTVVTSYSGLLTELTRLIDGEDTGVSDIATETLQQIVNMGERRIYREVRSRHNEVAFNAVAVTSNLAPIPVDFEASSIVHFGKCPLRPVAETWIQEWLQYGNTGDCIYFAEAGSNFLFAPAVSDATLVQGRYFCRLPDLTNDNFSANALAQYEVDLFIYAALAESGPYFGDDNMKKLPFWEGKYTLIRDRVNEKKQRAATSGGRMQRRPSTTLMR